MHIGGGKFNFIAPIQASSEL